MLSPSRNPQTTLSLLPAAIRVLLRFTDLAALGLLIKLDKIPSKDRLLARRWPRQMGTSQAFCGIYSVFGTNEPFLTKIHLTGIFGESYRVPEAANEH
jgi:hypothetical protein